MEVKLGL